MAQEPLLCHYCKREIPPGEETRDHVVPRARGGKDERWNIVWSCADCNVDKGDAWPTCGCNFCRRSRRRHWEKFQINESTYVPRSALDRARLNK